ncbi:MAG: type III pantothenate kinase [Armatimonadetes bacterium]|nr:type III pantothenate kinase [Armatimonadota bacterium]
MDGRRRPLLLVDIGNTSIHWAPYDGEWGASRRLWTHAAESFGGQYDAGIRVERSRPEVAVVCSGVPHATQQITDALQARGLEVLVLGHSLPATMPVRYAEPARLGQDRLANAVAAHARVGGAVIVVDVGTAITVDAVSSAGEFLGGAIAPGPQSAWAGLWAGVCRPAFAAVDADWLDRPPARVAPIGGSTQQCLEAGLRLGFAGLVDRLVREQRLALGAEVPVLWTGGAAAVVRPHAEEAGDFDELLTLRGLALIYEASLPPP